MRHLSTQVIHNSSLVLDMSRLFKAPCKLALHVSPTSVSHNLIFGTKKVGKTVGETCKQSKLMVMVKITAIFNAYLNLPIFCCLYFHIKGTTICFLWGGGGQEDLSEPENFLPIFKPGGGTSMVLHYNYKILFSKSKLLPFYNAKSHFQST